MGFALYLVTYEVVRMVHTFAYPKLTLEPGPSVPSRLSSGYGFLTLLGAMYLQMYWLVAAGEKHVARCRYCGTLIRLTARAKLRKRGQAQEASPGQALLQRCLPPAPSLPDQDETQA